MANYGYTRLRAPRKVKKGEMFKVKIITIHPMEGIKRNAGVIMDKNYHMIHKITIFLNDKKIVDIMPTQSVSSNPFFSFPLKIMKKGEIKVILEDTFDKKVVKKRIIDVIE